MKETNLTNTILNEAWEYLFKVTPKCADIHLPVIEQTLSEEKLSEMPNARIFMKYHCANDMEVYAATDGQLEALVNGDFLILISKLFQILAGNKKNIVTSNVITKTEYENKTMSIGQMRMYLVTTSKKHKTRICILIPIKRVVTMHLKSG